MSSRRLSPTKAAWSVGVSSAAAVFLILAGVFQFLEGLAAILGGNYFVTGPAGYTYAFDPTSWGWIHLIIGLIAVATGVGLFAVAGWARVMGILISLFGAVVNFLWLPYQPWWSFIVIVIYAVVIWALTNYDRAAR